MHIKRAWQDNPETVRAQQVARTVPLTVLAVKTADEESSPPPNYRPSDTPGQSCATCRYYHNGQCGEYHSPVEADKICDSFHPSEHAFSSDITSLATPVAPVEPIGPGQTLPIGKSDSLSSHSDHLTPTPPAEAFKVGFYMRCQQEGLTTEQMHERVKQANAAVAAAGIPLVASGLLSAAGAVPATALAGAGLIAAPMWLAGSMAANQAHDLQKNVARDDALRNRVDVQDFQNLELINEYKRMRGEVQRQMELKKQEAIPSQSLPGRRSLSFG